LFSLVERFVRDGEEDVKVWVRIEFCETLLTGGNRLERALPYLGPATIDLCRSVYASFGGDDHDWPPVS